MDAHIKDLKAKNNPEWKRQLVLSFETTLSDPKVSSNVQQYIVPDSDPTETLRGQLGLKTVMASDIFVIGVYRSRMMLELPTYVEEERQASVMSKLPIHMILVFMCCMQQRLALPAKSLL